MPTAADARDKGGITAQKARTPEHFEALLEWREAKARVRYLQGLPKPANDAIEQRGCDLTDAVEARERAAERVREIDEGATAK